MAHRDGCVLSQQQVASKYNEISCFQRLLDTVGIIGVMITADARNTQRAHAQYLVAERDADYVLTVKTNPPGIYATLNNLP